jgi:DNA-binding response OmpR family regulator
MTQSVLVIDDDPRICRLIAMGFERKGYTVFEASNGRAGLKIFHAEQPDLVITDILMPEMEGIQTIMEMKKAGPGAPKIIAISGGGRLVGREFLKWASHLGADEVMAKPFRVSALVALARDLLAACDADAEDAAPTPPGPLFAARPAAVAERWEYQLDRRHARLAA